MHPSVPLSSPNRTEREQRGSVFDSMRFLNNKVSHLKSAQRRRKDKKKKKKMLACRSFAHVGDKLKLKLSRWVLASPDIHARVWSPPKHIYYLCRPSCWVKQPHNQTQIIGAKGSGVGALVIYELSGTYNRHAHSQTRASHLGLIIHTHWHVPTTQHSSYRREGSMIVLILGFTCRTMGTYRAAPSLRV